MRSSEFTVMVVTIDDSFPGGTHLGLFEALDVHASSGRFEDDDEDEAAVMGDNDESLSGSDESLVDALTKRMRS